MSQCYVIKQMVSATVCTIELWMHLGGLLSAQEARGYHLRCDSYASFMLSNLPCASITQYSARYGVYHLLILTLTSKYF